MKMNITGEELRNFKREMETAKEPNGNTETEKKNTKSEKNILATLYQ